LSDSACIPQASHHGGALTACVVAVLQRRRGVYA